MCQTEVDDISKEKGMELGNYKRNARAFRVIRWCIYLSLIILIALEILTYSPCSSTEKAKATTTKAKLDILHHIVEAFKQDTGRYPSQQVGLNELLEKPEDVTGWDPEGYLESDDIPEDGWGNKFIYKLNPKSGKPFVIISYGADDKPGGEDYDADLYSTDLN